MTNFAARISGAALLALAALPMAALATAAHAAPAVKVADLNVLTAQGSATFSDRAETAINKFCRGKSSVRAHIDCREGVRAELNEKLDGLRQAQLRQAQTFAAR